MNLKNSDKDYILLEQNKMIANAKDRISEEDDEDSRA